MRPFIENASPIKTFSRIFFFSVTPFSPQDVSVLLRQIKKRTDTHTYTHTHPVCTPYANNREHRRVSCRYGSHRFVGTKLSNAKLSSVYCALTVRQSPIAIFDSYLFREGCRGKRISFYSSALESFREISVMKIMDFFRYSDIFLVLDRKKKKREKKSARSQIIESNRIQRENFWNFSSKFKEIVFQN